MQSGSKSFSLDMCDDVTHCTELTVIPLSFSFFILQSSTPPFATYISIRNDANSD